MIEQPPRPHAERPSSSAPDTMPKRTGRRWREQTVPRVLRRDGGLCHLCGRPEADTADHITPWSQGGTDALTNLASAHVRCNQMRGARPIGVARAEIAADLARTSASTTTTWEW